MRFTRLIKATRHMSEGLYILLVSFLDTHTLISQMAEQRPVKSNQMFVPRLNS